MADVIEKPKSSERHYWVDSFKAIAIFLIVYGHTSLAGGVIKDFIYIFHVPGFILIGGFWLNKDSNTLSFIKKRFFGIYVPYLIAGVISILVFALLGRFAQGALGGNYELGIVNNLKGLLYGNPNYNMKYNLPLWYLPFIFITEIIALLLIKLINLLKLKREYYSIFALLFFCVGWLVYRYAPLPNLSFGLENTIFLIGFLFMGYGLKDFIIKTRTIDYKIRAIISLILLGLSIWLFTLNPTVNYTSSRYGNYFIFVSAALVINISFMLIIPKNNIKLASFIGKNTLFILLFHKFPILFFQIITPKIGDALKSNNLLLNTSVSIIISIVAIISCILLQIIFDFVLKSINKKNKTT